MYALRGTMRTFTYSEIETFLRCEQKHDYAYERKLEPLVAHKALSRGTIIHTCVELFWKHREAEIEPTILAWDTESEQERALVTWLMTRYIQRYARDREQTLVVATEFPWRVQLDTFALAGWIDRLVIREGRLWLVETKTMGDWGRINNLSMDPQLSIYYWALRELGFNVWGAEFDAIYTYRWVRDERPVDASFAIVRLDRDNDQLDKFVRDAREVCRRISSRRRSEPIKNVIQFGPMACSGCAFRDPCFESLGGHPDEEELLLAENYKRKEGSIR